MIDLHLVQGLVKSDYFKDVVKDESLKYHNDFEIGHGRKIQQ